MYRAGGEGVPGVDVKFNIAGHDEPVTVTVANHTQEEWPLGGSIYVFCPHLLAAGGNEWDLKEQIWDLAAARERARRRDHAADTKSTMPEKAPKAK